MSRPEYGKTILAIDPGYRMGCKICILDTLGNPILFDKVFLHEEPQLNTKLLAIFAKYPIDTVVVGNGTGCDEICACITDIFHGDVVVVNES